MTANGSKLALVHPDLRAANGTLQALEVRNDELFEKLTRAEENLATMYAENERYSTALKEIRRIELEAGRSGMVGLGEVHDVLVSVGL